MNERINELESKIQKAIDLGIQYGQIDGSPQALGDRSDVA
jgi:hypothetical protein